MAVEFENLQVFDDFLIFALKWYVATRWNRLTGRFSKNTR